MIGETIGEPYLDTPRPLAKSLSTFSPLITSQLNPTPRKWKQLAQQVHVGDSSMQNTVAGKRFGEECG